MKTVFTLLFVPAIGLGIVSGGIAADRLAAPVIALPGSIAAPASAIHDLRAAPDDEMQALKKRFEERYPRLREMRAGGVVGETDAGYVEFVKDSNPDAEALVEQENADRRKLYELIAKKEGVSADTVARRNAKRNFEKAAKGDFLKRGGVWTQKE